MQKAVPEEKQCVAKGHVHALETSLLQPKIFEAKCHITWSLKTARTDAKFCAWICGWFWIKDAPIVHCLFVCFFPNFQFFLPFLMSVRKFGFFLIVLFLKIYDILNCIYQRQYFIIYYHDVIYCQTSSADKEEKMQRVVIYMNYVLLI